MLGQLKNIVSVQEWDDLVKKTYGRPYCFQQQDGCQERGTIYLTIPDGGCDYERDSVPEEVNGEIMGVSFAAWLSRDPKEWKGAPEDQDFIELFWHRNFYPDVQMIANDLHVKGLIQEGKYGIEIDW